MHGTVNLKFLKKYRIYNKLIRQHFIFFRTVRQRLLVQPKHAAVIIYDLCCVKGYFCWYYSLKAEPVRNVLKYQYSVI
jgi:hypothetical protein